MNEINWIIGNKYPVDDIMSQNEGTLIGFIKNQIPVSWKDQTSYSNHSDRTIYFVLEYACNYSNKTRYILALPQLDGWISDVMHDNAPYSRIKLRGIEYGDSIDELIKKVKSNWVFTPKLTYASTYKENFDYTKDLDWYPENNK